MITTMNTDTETLLSPAHFQVWVDALSRPVISEHAFRQLVLAETSAEFLVKQLVSLYYVQLIYKKWKEIDSIKLAIYAQEHGKENFIKIFFGYINANKKYMINDVIEDLNKQPARRKYIKYIKNG